MHDLSCPEVLDAAPQFALDILESSRRSLVAAHLIRCAGCRDTVTGMQESAAALLDLDGADWSRPLPDPGADDPNPCTTALRHGRRRLRLVITLAAAALIMVGTTLGPEMEAVSRRSPTPVARADLIGSNGTVGVVSMYSGSSPALDLQVSGLSVEGSITCETVSPDGTVTRLGSFGLYEGHGYWATNHAVDAAKVSSVVLVDGQGRVIASTSGAPALS